MNGLITGICPECEQGKCVNCTKEALVGEMLIACGCMEPVHLAAMENEIYRLVEGSAHVGVTVPEIRRIKGIKDPEVPLGFLAASGHVVRTERARDGWAVYVSHLDAPSPQIDVQSVEDNKEGTDMSDESTKEGLPPEGEELGLLRRHAAATAGRVGIVLVSDAEVMQPRLSALAGAKSILGEDQKSAGPLSHPTKTRPSVDDLLRLAVYIGSGKVLNGDLKVVASDA